jgi:hypothetical protein
MHALHVNIQGFGTFLVPFVSMIFESRNVEKVEEWMRI